MIVNLPICLCECFYTIAHNYAWQSDQSGRIQADPIQIGPISAQVTFGPGSDRTRPFQIQTSFGLDRISDHSFKSSLSDRIKLHIEKERFRPKSVRNQIFRTEFSNQDQLYQVNSQWGLYHCSASWGVVHLNSQGYNKQSQTKAVFCDFELYRRTQKKKVWFSLTRGPSDLKCEKQKSGAVGEWKIPNWIRV